MPIRKCEICQRFSRRMKALGSLPLHPISIKAPFKQWGIEFIGEISYPSISRHKCILVATNYFTKWVEAIPTKKETHQVVIDFLLNHIICRFGLPIKIVANNAMCFRAKPLMAILKEYGTNLTYASNYKPQGNGQDESRNKNLLKIITRTLELNKRKWGEQLKFIVLDDKITPKRATGKSPFELVYGTQAFLPLHLQLSSF